MRVALSVDGCKADSRLGALARFFSRPGRIHIEKINGPFLKVGSAAEYGGGLAYAIARGWLWKHETWEKTLGLGWKDNLCISCIEARLGRQLGFLHGDFAGVPSVEGFPCSETLRKRYGLKVRKARKPVKRPAKQPVKRTAKKARKRTA